MGQCRHHRHQQRRKAALLICAVVAIVVVIVLVILYYAVFKPHDPTVQVPVMQMPFFSINGSPPSTSTVSFTLILGVSIYNPNRATLHLENPISAALFHGASPLGVSPFAPDASISSQSSLAFGITVPSRTPLYLNLTAPYTVPSSIPLPISSVVTIYSHVKNAGLFSLQSAVASVCNITIMLAGSTGSLLGYSCHRSYSLNN